MLCPRWSCCSHTRYRMTSMTAAAPACKSLGKNLMLAYPGTCRKERCGSVESDGRQRQGSKEPTNRSRQQQTNAHPAVSKAVRDPRHVCSHIAARTQSHLGLGDRSMTTPCKTSTASPCESTLVRRGARIADKLIRLEVGTCRVRGNVIPNVPYHACHFVAFGLFGKRSGSALIPAVGPSRPV